MIFFSFDRRRRSSLAADIIFQCNLFEGVYFGLLWGRLMVLLSASFCRSFTCHRAGELWDNTETLPFKKKKSASLNRTTRPILRLPIPQGKQKKIKVSGFKCPSGEITSEFCNEGVVYDTELWILNPTVPTEQTSVSVYLLGARSKGGWNWGAEGIRAEERTRFHRSSSQDRSIHEL